MSDLSYKNLNLHYTDQGRGEPLVLLHGFLEEKGMWKEVAAAFEKTHRVICMDFLGHGKTGNLGYIHSMETQAEMLKFLLDNLGIEKSYLIGHSMGGYVALAFADLYRNSVMGICLMNSTAMADDAEKKINRDRGIVAVKQNHKTFMRIAIPGLFSQENQSIFSDEIEEITKKALNMSQQGIIASLEGMKMRVDRSHLLEQNDFPILMVIGEKDPALDVNSLKEQAKKGHVQSVIFEDGHMSHIENKKELIEVLSKWLSPKTTKKS
jgi:pimeloyl-ACP methyl ester carboxylesterase